MIALYYRQVAWKGPWHFVLVTTDATAARDALNLACEQNPQGEACFRGCVEQDAVNLPKEYMDGADPLDKFLGEPGTLVYQVTSAFKRFLDSRT